MARSAPTVPAPGSASSTTPRREPAADDIRPTPTVTASRRSSSPRPTPTSSTSSTVTRPRRGRASRPEDPRQRLGQRHQGGQGEQASSTSTPSPGTSTPNGLSSVEIHGRRPSATAWREPPSTARRTGCPRRPGPPPEVGSAGPARPGGIGSLFVGVARVYPGRAAGARTRTGSGAVESRVPGCWPSCSPVPR